MRVMLVLLAMANLFFVLVMLPLTAYSRASLMRAQWVRPERSLVDSGQLVFNPAGHSADPSHAMQHAFDGELFRHLAQPVIDDETDVGRTLLLYLMVQTAVLLVLAWVAPQGKLAFRWHAVVTPS